MSPSEAAGKRKQSPSRTRTYLEAHAGGARRSIEDALHLPHRARVGPRLPPVEHAAPAEARAAVLQLRAELVEERKEVLEPLLHRMSELADLLTQGKPVPAQVIRDGLDLWQVYVERLHDVHVGQFAAARSSSPHTDSCTLPLVELSEDPERAELRIGEVRLVLVNYESKPKLNAALLGSVLNGSVRSELAWEHFEEDLTRSCLPNHLTIPALQQWATALVETHAAAESTRAKVASFLERTAAEAIVPGMKSGV
ncbi:MAG TPA: hypothetical protein VMF04_07370 [Thermoplasmata archaeon]|nr:hypothetical protein [Thermoplasmata archaeon]